MEMQCVSDPWKRDGKLVCIKDLKLTDYWGFAGGDVALPETNFKCTA